MCQPRTENLAMEPMSGLLTTNNPIVYIMLHSYSIINLTWVNLGLIQVMMRPIVSEFNEIFYIYSIWSPYEPRKMRKFVFFITIFFKSIFKIYILPCTSLPIFQSIVAKTEAITNSVWLCPNNDLQISKFVLPLC